MIKNALTYPALLLSVLLFPSIAKSSLKEEDRENIDPNGQAKSRKVSKVLTKQESRAVKKRRPDFFEPLPRERKKKMVKVNRTSSLAKASYP